MGIASFVVGLLCLILSPFLNILLILPSILGLLLGIIDAVLKSKKNASKSFAIAGIVLSIIALVACVIVVGVKYFIFDSITFPYNSALEPAPKQKNIVVGVDEPATVDDVTVTLTNLEYDFKDYYDYAYVDDDCVILKADFEFKNNGEYNEYISYSDFECFADKFTCEEFLSVEDAYFYETVEPGETATGTIYFEIPDDAEKIQIEFSLSIYDSTKAIFEATF